MDLLEVTDKLTRSTGELLALDHGCRCDTSRRVRNQVSGLNRAAATMVQIEKNKLDYQFAEQMGMVEEGWADYQNYLTGSRFAL